MILPKALISGDVLFFVCLGFLLIFFSAHGRLIHTLGRYYFYFSVTDSFFQRNLTKENFVETRIRFITCKLLFSCQMPSSLVKMDKFVN